MFYFSANLFYLGLLNSDWLDDVMCRLANRLAVNTDVGALKMISSLWDTLGFIVILIIFLRILSYGSRIMKWSTPSDTLHPNYFEFWPSFSSIYFLSLIWFLLVNQTVTKISLLLSFLIFNFVLTSWSHITLPKSIKLQSGSITNPLRPFSFDWVDPLSEISDFCTSIIFLNHYYFWSQSGIRKSMLLESPYNWKL